MTLTQTKLRRAHDAASFAGDDGAWLAGRSWLYLRADPSTYALVFFGKPSADDAAQLVPALRTELGAPAHVSLVDASRIDAVDPRSFLLLNRYVVDNRAALSACVTRLGLVRPGGFAGAVVAGFFGLLDTQPYPTKVVATVDEAARYIERPALPQLLAPLIDDVDTTPAIVRRLQQLFLAHGFDLGTGEAARALALSSRTLQRRLQEAGTSFVDVRMSARLERAKERMLDEDDAPLTAIALDLGFSSTQHFSSMFRKHTGKTPSAWRDAERTRR